MEGCRRMDYQRIHFNVSRISILACLRATGVRWRWRKRDGRPVDLFRFHLSPVIFQRVISSCWFRPCSKAPALKQRLKPVGHAVPSKEVATVFASYRRTREAVWVVGFDWRVQQVGGHSLRVLLGAAVGHEDWSRTVEIGEVDFAHVIIPKMYDERWEALAPLDFTRYVRSPDLDQSPGRLNSSFEYDDYLEMFGEHGFGREGPKWTRRGDLMCDSYRPETEDKVVRYTRLSDEFERVLAEGYQLTLVRQSAPNEECSDRRTDDVRLAKIADAEDEIVETVSHADDGMLTEDDRLRE